jgi:hypothetical protein
LTVVLSPSRARGLSFVTHVRYNCVRTARAIPILSFARRIGVERGGDTFEEILDQAIAMLQRRGRLTYSTLKRQFQLDDDALEDLKNELIEGQRLAVDEGGNVLVWTGAEVPTPNTTTPSASGQDRAPLAYTPSILPRRFYIPAAPWKASASRSRCCSLT